MKDLDRHKLPFENEIVPISNCVEFLGTDYLKLHSAISRQTPNLTGLEHFSSSGRLGLRAVCARIPSKNHTGQQNECHQQPEGMHSNKHLFVGRPKEKAIGRADGPGGTTILHLLKPRKEIRARVARRFRRGRLSLHQSSPPQIRSSVVL